MRVALVLLVAIGCSSSRRAEPAAEKIQVPGDTAFFATLSIAKLRASVLWPRIEAVIANLLPLDRVRRSCSVDPLQALESLSLSVPAEFHPERMIAYARGVARSVVDQCAKTLTAAQNQVVTITDEDKLVAYRQKDGVMFAAWLDARTFAVTPGDLGAPERLQLLVGKPQPPLAEFAEQRSKMASGHTLAFAFAAPPETDMRAFVRESGVEPIAGHGWLDLDTALRGELTLRFESAAQATSVAQDIAKRAADSTSPAATLLRGIRATASSSDVVITLQLDKAATEQLISLVASAAPSR